MDDPHQGAAVPLETDHHLQNNDPPPTDLDVTHTILDMIERMTNDIALTKKKVQSLWIQIQKKKSEIWALERVINNCNIVPICGLPTDIILEIFHAIVQESDPAHFLSPLMNLKTPAGRKHKTYNGKCYQAANLKAGSKRLKLCTQSFLEGKQYLWFRVVAKFCPRKVRKRFYKGVSG
ncbi:hypothetical protein F5146DRAFT_1124889 [Armillaria mellea]|nr:hypothetical protein F5146DRAFT_1124889 [Armillaria mellea]